MTDEGIEIRLPVAVASAALRLADRDGVPLDRWVARAVAQKIGSVDTAAEFFDARAAGARAETLLSYLGEAPDVPPMPGDELPATLAVEQLRSR